MRRTSLAYTLALPLLLVGLACGRSPVEPSGRFDFTFSGDASFQSPLGGQTVQMALVRPDLRVTGTSVVSATANPSFSFNFPGRLNEGETYRLDYWIDSNFGGGTPGVCDPPGIDHQWRIVLGVVRGDVVIEDTHRPNETESVCATFQ